MTEHVKHTAVATRFRHPGNAQKHTGFLRVKLVEKPSKKPAPNLIQFEFVLPVIY